MRGALIGLVGRNSAAYRVLKSGYEPFSRVVSWCYLRSGEAFSKPPVLIGGAPRSGTTLLLSILSAHPSFFAIDHETFAFCPRAVDPDGASPADFEPHRAYTPLALQGAVRKGDRWVEKTPRNVRFLGPIFEHFGADVRFIHIVRDGRAVINSMSPREPERAYTGIEGWTTPVAAGLHYDGHEQLHRLRFEDLVGSFESTIRGLLAFLDEPWVDGMADWYEHATVRRHTGLRGSIQPLDPHVAERWRQPEFAGRVAALESDPVAAELLRELGYD